MAALADRRHLPRPDRQRVHRRHRRERDEVGRRSSPCAASSTSAPADELVAFARAQRAAGPRPHAAVAQPAPGLAHRGRRLRRHRRRPSCARSCASTSSTSSATSAARSSTGTSSTRSSTTTATCATRSGCGSSAPGYIADAFRWAHQADPHGQALPQRLQRRVPVRRRATPTTQLAQRPQQASASRCTASAPRATSACSTACPPPCTIAGTSRGFEALGLETSITEVDVRMIMPAGQRQAAGPGAGLQRPAAGLPARPALRTRSPSGASPTSTPGCPASSRAKGAANLLDENFQPKPAYDELLAVLTLAGDD